MFPFAGQQVTVTSPFPPEECASLLRAAVDREGAAGVKPVVGVVTRSSVRLHKRPGFHNSFRAFLIVSLRPEGSGTVLSGRVGLRPFVRSFVIFWFAVVGLASAATTVAFLLAVAQGRGSEASPGLGIPPLMAVAAGLVWGPLYWFTTRGQAKFLADFLAGTVQAVRHGPGPSK